MSTPKGQLETTVLTHPFLINSTNLNLAYIWIILCMRKEETYLSWGFYSKWLGYFACWILVGEFGDIKGSCGLKSLILGGSNSNCSEDWKLKYQFANIGATVLHGFLLRLRWDLVQFRFIPQRFCFLSNANSERGKLALRCRKFQELQGILFPRGLNCLLADKNVLSRQEFSFSSEFRSSLKRFWIGTVFSIGKGEKA